MDVFRCREKNLHQYLAFVFGDSREEISTNRRATEKNGTGKQASVTVGTDWGSQEVFVENATLSVAEQRDLGRKKERLEGLRCVFSL